MSPDLYTRKRKWEEDDIRFHQKDHNSHMPHFVNKLPLGRIFVPLCGKSKDMLWLLSKGYEVIGVEISPIACRDFFNGNNLSFTMEKVDGFEKFVGDGITLWCGD